MMQTRQLANLALGASLLGAVITASMLWIGLPGDIVLAAAGIIGGVIVLRRLRGQAGAPARRRAVAAVTVGCVGLLATTASAALFMAYVFGADEQGDQVIDVRMEAWPVDDGERQVAIRLHGWTGNTSVPFDGHMDYRVLDAEGATIVDSGFDIEYDRFWGEPRTYTWHLVDSPLNAGTTYTIEGDVTVDATGQVFLVDARFTMP